MKSTYYALTKEDEQAIEFHKKTFEEINNIGFDILDMVLGGEKKLENYKIPIRSILYRFLEFNDTLNVMVQNSLISTAFPILRSEFEIFIQLLYLFKESNQIEKKALLYHYCDITRINSSLGKEELNEFLSQHKYLDSIHQKYFKDKRLNSRPWYNLYEEEVKSFKDLCKKVEQVEYYDTLYGHLSADIHGTGCTELNSFYDDSDEKYYLLNFRHFKRHHTLMVYHIEFSRNIFLCITNSFKTNMNIKNEVDDFYTRAEEYVVMYKKMKGGFLDPLPEYST